jgi:hypothetical protein
MSTNNEETAETSLSKADIAWLINALWEALQSPGWTFGTRKDLEKLGEAIFSGKTLNQVDDKLLTRLLPHLRTIATHLGQALIKHRTPTAEVAPTSSPEASPPSSSGESHE